MRPARTVRLTRRGAWLAAVGGALLVSGVLLGVASLVQGGALVLLTVATGFTWLVVEAGLHRRGRLQLTRRITPHPVTVGRRAVVSVVVTSPGTPRRVTGLQVAERAARELSGPQPLRARVERAAGRLTLTYAIHPEQRGRWTVGPLEVRSQDLFGVAHSSGRLGQSAQVAVRPATTALHLTRGPTATDVDRSSAGARTPAADDSSLRDYRPGDDLRRVHWQSTARRGQVMVRQDERAGRRAASVLLDLPLDREQAEWSISAAASIALALADEGHHVRLLDGSDHGIRRERGSHHAPDVDGATADALLDQTVDLVVPATEEARERALLRAVETLTGAAGGAEVVFAVVGGLEQSCLEALARVGQASHGWAVVRATGAGVERVDGPARHSLTTREQHTHDALRRAGWTVAVARPGEDLTHAWERLLAADDRLGARA
ncbi:DUF58 domain-containing protein [Actinotalea sp. K2]|uniref:DUF58 domain-containing protein n=1 Tax=Actinotalea sp. K2 TaxID=2939438 RepID=UPI002017C7F5|nr:DUF58 domain-containing protein [Actinotalea sp. K2]MCL3860132.1 DUF58 domain-containing protein [Actinotalea sp. K2]